jgi:glycosyltransferase involved in cell wall biosynthesis
VIPEGIGFKGLIDLFNLAFNIWKEFGFSTLWRKVSYKISRRDEQEFNIWRRENEPKAEELDEQRITSKAFLYRPLISIIMPVYNPPGHILQASVDSILCQTYENWELCVAEGSDPTSRPEIKVLLDNYSRNDKRIKTIYLNKNKGISINSNKALELAEGEFIALVDHDDLIAPFALFRIIECLNQNRDIDFFYSDRDLLSWDGEKRSHPFFKTDWSPETLVSVNYLIHLAVIRKSLVDRAGGFFEEMDGAQDWDLFFRITEMTSKIVHIPEILYHWRIGPYSAAWSLMAKPYVVQAQFQAVKKHFERAGIDVKVTLGRSGFIRVKWNNSCRLKVSIVIVVKSSKKILEKSLRIILTKTKFSDYEIVLVGNKVEQPAIQHIPSGGLIRKVDPPIGLTIPELRNLGAQKAAGQVLIFMEDGLEVVDPDWLDDLTGWVSQKEIGAVGGKILNADRTIQSAGLIITESEKVVSPFAGLKEYYGKFGSSEWYRNYPVISGSCVTVRKEVFEEVHQFDTNVSDENNIMDFCFRLYRNGYRILYSPYERLRRME